MIAILKASFNPRLLKKSDFEQLGEKKINAALAND